MSLSACHSSVPFMPMYNDVIDKYHTSKRSTPCNVVAYTYAVRGTIEFVFLTVPMASAEFHEAVAYALSCIG